MSERWLPALLVLAGVWAGPRLGALEVAVREIHVESPGTVRVELDADEIVRLGDAGGVEAVGPDGERVGVERRLARAEAPCQTVEIGSVERGGAAWTLLLRVPGAAGAHGALEFELDETTLAAGCRLEARGEGGAWRLLATGDLFRVGEGSALARTRLAYPSTTARELRLAWPAEAGYPRVRSAAVCAPEAPRAALPWPAGAAVRAAPPGRARFALALPPRAARLAALDLALPAAPASELGWRLLFAQDGRWRELARGLWPQGRDRHRVELGDLAFAGRELRLELLGRPVGDLTASWELAPQVVRFDAARPGLWRLRIPAGVAPAAVRAGARSAVFAAGAGRCEPVSWPPPGGGAAVSASRSGRRFAVDTETTGAEVGAPLALEPPAGVLAQAGPGAGDLRLVANGHLVPARLEALPEPAGEALLDGLVPRPVGPGRSAIDIPLGEVRAGVESTGVVLGADFGARPFRRELEVVGIGGGAGPDREVRLGRRSWECSAAPDDACELLLEPAGRDLDRLRLEVVDGDSAPLPRLWAERLARRRQLVFQRPAGATELVVGAGAAAPRFDLTPLEAALALAPPAPTRLGAEIAAAGGGAERWARALLIVGVAAVALALLALLRRLLPPAAGAG